MAGGGSGSEGAARAESGQCGQTWPAVNTGTELHNNNNNTELHNNNVTVTSVRTSAGESLMRAKRVYNLYNKIKLRFLIAY